MSKLRTASLTAACCATSLALFVGVTVAEQPAEQPAGGGEEAAVEAPPEPTPEQVARGGAAFIEVAKVLQHPRCMNCHPAGNRPLQGDQSTPHALGISRDSVDAGLACSTCHQESNADTVGMSKGPPGAPHWGLPPEETPMVFQGLTPAQLCAQLKDPAKNGGKNLDQLLHHVSKDPLVLWGWNPGGDRTPVPIAHATFVENFEAWVDAAGACPE